MKAIVPLRLSGREQEFLARLCLHLRSYQYRGLAGDPMPAAQLEDILVEELARFGMEPTELDSLYDRLHRTGENS